MRQTELKNLKTMMPLAMLACVLSCAAVWAGCPTAQQFAVDSSKCGQIKNPSVVFPQPGTCYQPVVSGGCVKPNTSGSKCAPKPHPYQKVTYIFQWGLQGAYCSPQYGGTATGWNGTPYGECPPPPAP